MELSINTNPNIWLGYPMQPDDLPEIENQSTMLDVTISGPAGSGKTKLAAYIWPWFEGKRSLVQVHALQENAAKQAKTWNAVGADVIIFDGCFNSAYDIDDAKRLMALYRETFNPNAVAIYVIQTP
jgi:hypothetical protein